MKIIRNPSTPEGTFGTLYDDMGIELCVTAERPWDDNNPDTSCIPDGVYQFIPHDSPEHPNVWEIIGVPDRSEILIHNGNFPLTESLGCILVGMEVGYINGIKAVTHSDDALIGLRSMLPSTGEITITTETLQ